MSIKTYSDLSTDVQDRLHRSDLSAKVSTTVQLLEDELNRKLRCRQMITTTTIPISAATASLPADYLEMINVQLMTDLQPSLDFMTPEQISVYDRGLYTGESRMYTIRGSLLQVAPAPDATYDLNLEYYQQIPGLEANGTNWLLAKYPLIYVAGCLLILFEYVQNAAVLQWAQQKYDALIDNISSSDDLSQYAGSIIRVRPDTCA